MSNDWFITTIEAQFLMGHAAPGPHIGADHAKIVQYSWDENLVRQALHVPRNDVWHERVFMLEHAQLATFVGDGVPTYQGEDGAMHEQPGWRDKPRETWGYVAIYGAGVLRLAGLYGRPYVRITESPAVLRHWDLVQAETAARVQAFRADTGDWEAVDAQFAAEWPEKWRAEQTILRDWEARRDDDPE